MISPKNNFISVTTVLLEWLTKSMGINHWLVVYEITTLNERAPFFMAGSLFAIGVFGMCVYIYSYLLYGDVQCPS